jgi:adenylylsulfate kinase
MLEARSMESNTRSLAKAVSYRVLGSAVTALVVLIWTGRWGLSAGIGALDMLAKIGLYFLHERIWNHISFGRPKPPEYEI